MLIYFAIFALASAANIHDNRYRIVSPIVQRISERQSPVGLVQLLKSPVQSVYSPIDQVQYVEQSYQDLNPLKLQYSVISVNPNIGHSVQVNDQREVLTSIQPHNQQTTFLSTQPNFDRVISVGRVQPIDVQKRIVYQSVQPLTEGEKSEKQIVNVVRPDVYSQSVQNLRIGTSVQPLQYSNIVQPLEYRDSVPALAQLNPSLRLEGKGGQHLSYFVRGSDAVNQGVSQVYYPQVSTLEQLLEPPQYTSFSALEPQVSQVVVQPSKYIGYSDVNPNYKA
jgi:hypothetical protein